MIIANEKVRLYCDTEGCEESLRISLVLLPTGGWGIQFPLSAVNKWQCLVDNTKPMMPYSGRCPTHNQSRIIPVTGPLLVGTA